MATIYDTTALELKYAKITATGPGDTLVLAAVPGRKLVVLGYTVSSLLGLLGIIPAVKFKSGTVDITGPLYLNSPVVSASAVPVFETAVGQPLNINVDLVLTIGGHVTYVEV